jgi:hypothetical protein
MGASWPRPQVTKVKKVFAAFALSAALLFVGLTVPVAADAQVPFEI